MRVEQTSEVKEYTSGERFWRWMMSSNPISRMLLAGLALTPEQLDVVQQAADGLIRERWGRRPGRADQRDQYIGI